VRAKPPRSEELQRRFFQNLEFVRCVIAAKKISAGAFVECDYSPCYRRYWGETPAAAHAMVSMVVMMVWVGIAIAVVQL